MAAQWLEIGGGDLVAMGGNCDALGGYTMNWTKILLDKSSIRQTSYEKKSLWTSKKQGIQQTL